MTYPMQISETVRIDTGPPVRIATVTEGLLKSGRLASHYQLGAPDAMGGRRREAGLGQGAVGDVQVKHERWGGLS